MSVLTIHQLSKSFGDQDLFSGLSMSVPQRARIGLVGPNGVGKTTLLRIILGLEEASSGKVHIARGTRIGYLPQEAILESGRTLWDECLTVFAPLLEMQARLEALEAEMSDPARAEAALEAYGTLQHEFDRQGGYTYETRIRMTLTGLGFSREDERRPISQLSGGQRTRALLARLLLSAPDLLLLDEPTNHLDIAAVEWLEDYLKDWPGAVIIVSHDRYFLDQVVNTIWEMTPALEVYSGNYSAYLEQRAQRYREQLEAYQRQQEFIEKEEEYIRRNIAGQNTRQAQGRRKRLERMLEEALITPPRLQARKISLRLQPVNRSGDLVLRTYGLQVGYKDEGRPLFSAPDLILRRGECVAILGPNGAGKTTFLKTLLNQIPPFAGELQLGASLKLGYFAQAHEGLRPDYTLMEEISAAEPNLSAGEIRAYLARFLFTNDDVFKEVGMLSGGERARLALALLGLQGANLLLLDEPTNHLDLPAQEVLQSMLSEFNGTILLVTHDRYLIDALASQIWEVMPEQGQLTVFEGSYSDYKTFRQAAAGKAEENRARPAEPDPGDRRVERISKGKMKKRQQRLEALETQITKTEERCAVLARQLENPPADSAQVHRLGEEYTRLHQALEALIEEWSHLSKEVGNGE